MTDFQAGVVEPLFDLRSWLDTNLRAVTARTNEERGRLLTLLTLAVASSNNDLASFEPAKRKLGPREITICLNADGAFQLEVDEHPITVPCNFQGLEAIRRLLEARTHDHKPTVGKPSSPVQHLVNAWLKDGNVITGKPHIDLEGIEI